MGEPEGHPPALREHTGDECQQQWHEDVRDGQPTRHEGACDRAQAGKRDPRGHPPARLRPQQGGQRQALARGVHQQRRHHSQRCGQRHSRSSQEPVQASPDAAPMPPARPGSHGQPMRTTAPMTAYEASAVTGTTHHGTPASCASSHASGSRWRTAMISRIAEAAANSLAERPNPRRASQAPTTVATATRNTATSVSVVGSSHPPPSRCARVLCTARRACPSLHRTAAHVCAVRANRLRNSLFHSATGA